MELLQNTPLSRKNPLKNDTFLQAYQNLESNAKVGLSILGTATLFFLLVIGMGFYEVFGNPSNGNGMPISSLLELDFMAIIIGVGVSIFFIVFFLNKQRKLAIREQQIYYKLGNVQPLDIDQKKAIRLNLVQVFYGGGWSNTLEVFPCNIRLDKQNFKPKTFDIQHDKLYQQYLNEDWGVLNKEQYQEMIARLFEGMHSKWFAQDIQSDSAEDMINQISGLTKVDEEYINECGVISSDKPKKLIWGFDLFRVIPMSRWAFMSGYITEEEAWSNILKASKLVYFLFDSHEDFYNNYRVGHAFWGNNFEASTDRLEKWKYFKEHCDWPARDLEWTKPTEVKLPENMKTNFGEHLSNIQKQQRKTTIGFRKT
ncbi:DUF1266 domain-containing protein [uncultured Aquimarina sp.]|uniref:DUF1266 domain-containing protein n=1 Tax=uncultured Aquimarina sp. TaxID=575652 RepID=UPI002619D8DF|nr:DUF1266 domain-containing protein [uncultured Aquimarina sp.]